MKNAPDFDGQSEPKTVTNLNRKSLLRWIFRLILGISIVAFLASRHDFSALTRSLRTVSPSILLISVAFYWLGQAICAWKWQILLRAQGAEVSWVDCCRLYAVGMFWNLWMPTNIGGDAVRALRSAPLCGGKIIATSSIMMDRLTGVAALICIALVGILTQSFAADSVNVSLSTALRPIFVLLSVLVIGGTGFVLWRRKAQNTDAEISPIRRKTRAFADALAVYGQRSSRGVLWRAFALSLIFQGSQVLLNIGLAHVIGLTIPAITFWWLVPSLAIASLVPLGIGGLGVREAAAIQLLAAWNSSAAVIVAWSLLWQATVWLASFPGALWAAQPIPKTPDKL